jgi:hypothetical protein
LKLDNCQRRFDFDRRVEPEKGEGCDMKNQRK